MMRVTLAQMEVLGADIAAQLCVGDVIGLSGDLGAGKTTLARGILRALGLESEAPSPSFAIVQPYAPPETRMPVLHVDLYRIKSPAELGELGLDEARCDHAMLIEWPEHMGARAWDDMLNIRLEWAGDDARCLTVNAPPSWEGRCHFLK
ncbi:MAG: tRNA (adenosine(37)-N6)-threonylcarbamoyltransferase complex ATPase subunit type 1 TsaE [Sphingopyxis sp.]